MSSLWEFHKLNRIFFVLGYVIICGHTLKIKDKNSLDEIRSGKYIPQAFGAYRGQYIPDDSGRYHHIFIPYTGGYGDNGVPYEHQGPTVTRKPLQLGPDDHLRLLLDYNYESGGWQVVKFDWTRDDEYGKPQPKYNFMKKYKLWSTNDENDPYDDDDDDDDEQIVNDQNNNDMETVDYSDFDGYEYNQNYGNESEASGSNDVGNEYQTERNEYQLEDESETMRYDYEYSTEINVETKREEIHQTIGDFLDYVKSNLLPSFV